MPIQYSVHNNGAQKGLTSRSAMITIARGQSGTRWTGTSARERESARMSREIKGRGQCFRNSCLQALRPVVQARHEDINDVTLLPRSRHMGTNFQKNPLPQRKCRTVKEPAREMSVTVVEADRLDAKQVHHDRPERSRNCTVVHALTDDLGAATVRTVGVTRDAPAS